MPGRGRKKNYKGAHRHFTDPTQIDAQAEKERKEKEWRKQRGELDSDEEEEQEDTQARAPKPMRTGAPGELPPSDSETESDSEDEQERHKGVEHLIAVQNPNHVAPKMKKVTDLEKGGDAKPQLTRKEREELQKQQAKANYMKQHLAGKTDEAQADLARLALIRKQREEAAAKRDAEKKVADDKKKAAEQKLLDKKAQK